MRVRVRRRHRRAWYRRSCCRSGHAMRRCGARCGARLPRERSSYRKRASAVNNGQRATNAYPGLDLHRGPAIGSRTWSPIPSQRQSPWSAVWRSAQRQPSPVAAMLARSYLVALEIAGDARAEIRRAKQRAVKTEHQYTHHGRGPGERARTYAPGLLNISITSASTASQKDIITCVQSICSEPIPQLQGLVTGRLTFKSFRFTVASPSLLPRCV